MEFTYGRLKFKYFTKEDFKLFSSVFSNEQVMRYAWIDEIKSEEEMLPFFEDFINFDAGINKNNSYAFAVFLCEDDTFIGFADIVIHSQNSYGGIGELGYFLLPEFWGKGYATEIAGALLEIGFTKLKLHKMSARCHSDNHKSESVMKKVSMTKEGEFKKVRLKRGKWDDEKHYGILIEEWKAKNPAS